MNLRITMLLVTAVASLVGAWVMWRALDPRAEVAARRDVGGGAPERVLARSDPTPAPPSQRSRVSAEAASAPARGVLETLSLEELQAPCRCAAESILRKEQDERDWRNAQSKDSAWAYEAELLLRQFIASHPLSREMDNVGVECRTTFCEVRVDGASELWDGFQEVIAQAALAPWSTFGPRREYRNRSEEPGRSTHEVLLYRKSVPEDAVLPERPPPDTQESCLCASRAWRERRAMLEADALARETKDPYWAFATEQRLNQLMASHESSSFLASWTIDCRETYCDILATSAGEDGGKFSEMIVDVTKSPTLEFSGDMSFATSGVGSTVRLEARLMRRVDTTP